MQYQNRATSIQSWHSSWHQSLYNSTKEEEYLHLIKDLLKEISSFGVFMTWLRYCICSNSPIRHIHNCPLTENMVTDDSSDISLHDDQCCIINSQMCVHICNECFMQCSCYYNIKYINMKLTKNYFILTDGLHSYKK